VARSTNWETRLFNTVAEAVEFTAIQRGIERWEPAGASVAMAPPKPVPVAAAPGRAGDPVRIVEDPPWEDRFTLYVPFYDVAAAAGPFGPEQRAVDPHDHHTWIRVEEHRLTPDMFAIRVRGRSMEPMIPDGAYCLFRGGDALAGSREGRVVLVVLREGGDPETGGRLTVKRYHSEKTFDDIGVFRHTRIELRPVNPEFDPIVIEGAEEDSLRVVGGFVATLGSWRDPGASGQK
jgi:SOS-response transcriptional repressor LexA